MDRAPTDYRDIDEFDALKVETIDAKKGVNSLQQQNVHLNTRMKSVEKEINRRMRLLRELWSLSKANLPLTHDVVNRLGDDRNGLSLYRQRCNLLEEALLDREEEIADLKHQETFTKIVELEGAFTALRSEATRIHSLMERTPEVNQAVESELLAYQQLCETLEKDVTSLDYLRKEQLQEVTEKQEDYQVLSTDLRETEDELSYEQQQVADATSHYDALVGENSHKEALLEELEQMEEGERKRNIEISKMETNIAKLIKQSNRGRYTITADKFAELEEDTVELFGRIRSRWIAHDADSPDSSTFLVQLLEADEQGEEKLSADKIFEVVRRFGLDVERDATVRAVCRLSPTGEERCSLFDFFIACLVSPGSSMPDPSDEQLKNLRERMPYETFRRKFVEVTHSAEITAMLGDAYWARFWEAYGAGGILRIPVWHPPCDALKLRLLESSSRLQKVLQESEPISTEEQLADLLEEACADDFYGPRDVKELMQLYASAPDLRVALLAAIS